MAKIIVYLREQDRAALDRLAEKEYRQPKAQAALIIRRELERLGILEVTPESERVCEEGSHEHCAE